jgi:branched-chain amino acid transport system permease protein
LDASLWTQILISGLTQGCLFALVAIGFNVIYSVAAMPNFAQAEFTTVGAFLIFYATRSYDIAIGWAILAVALLAACCGIVFQKLILYPARRASHMHQVLITIGGMYIVQGAVMSIWGIDPIMSSPFSGTEPVVILGAQVPTQSLWVIGITLFLTSLLHLFLTRTILGKALRTVAEKREFAAIVGINADAMDSIAWAIAAALGAVAGAIIAPLYPFQYQSGLMILTMVFCSVIIGGMGNVLGSLVGGIVIGLLLAIGAAFFAPFKEIVVFAALLLTLSLRPHGLLAGSRR